MVGFDVKNIDEINPLYVCQSCTLLLREPLQFADCGHRMCQCCANEQQG